MEDSGSSSKYLAALQRFKVKPNFWCSSEYFKHAEFNEVIVEISGGQKVCLVTDEDGDAVLPPFNLNAGRMYPLVPKGGIWADLEGFMPKNPAGRGVRFLDFNYIYDPAAFQEMKGKCWMVFRKNSRKFPRRYEGGHLVWVEEVSEGVEKFASSVLSFDLVHDADVVLRYLFKGENRLFLLDEGSGEVLAVNVWDENHMYVNYRYAFCVDKPFLSEYVRLCFYQTIHEKYPGKLVNDGGVLNRLSLKKFKDKLNPVEVFKVHSWRVDERQA
jgi:hypothetical protein